MFAFKGERAVSYSVAADGADRWYVHTAGDRTRRRRLNKLSCAGWVPHDRGFVSGLPRSRVEHRSGDRLITGHKDSPPWPCLPQCAPWILAELPFRLFSFRGHSDEFGLRNAGDRPDEADHLACNCSGDHDLRLTGCSETSIPRAQPDLRFPGAISLMAADSGWSRS